jgi:hypothetical protein
LTAPSELLALLPEAEGLWGYALTPATARLARLSGDQWRSVLREPFLLEARIFSSELDLHWLDGRGVCLRIRGVGEAGRDDDIAGQCWWWRDRRCRLWGENLEGHDAWYEERIPDPQRYAGLAPGAQSLYPFLRMREYLRAGSVRYVRFLEVEGGIQ